MRVLLVTSMFPPYCGGGVSAHVRDLAFGLAAEGEKVWVLSSRRGLPANGHDAPSSGSFPRVIFRRDLPDMALTVGGLARQFGHDIIHFHSFNSLALSFFARPPRGASVFTIHSDTANFMASVNAWRAQSHPGYGLIRLFERMSIRRPDVTIAVDRRLWRYAVSIGAKESVCIPNAVDIDYWSPGDKALEATQDQPVLFVPRMLLPKNGVDVAIRALAAVRAAHPETTMVIAGDGSLRASLTRLASDVAPGQVRFLGEVPRERMRDLYHSSDVVLIPSVTSSGLQEATSIAALEAMACGKPVVASAIGGLPEIISHGVDGLLVPEGNAAALAAAVNRLLDDTRFAVTISARAHERVARDFSAKAWTRRVLDAYSLALEIRRKTRNTRVT